MSVAVTFAAAALVTCALGVLHRPRWSRGGRIAIPAPQSIVEVTTPRWVQQALTELPWSIPASSAWLAARASLVLIVCAVAVAGAPALGLCLAGAGLGVPALLRPTFERRWWRRRDAQLPIALEHLAAELRSGSALGPAFVALGPATPEPLGTELRAAGAALCHGAGIQTVLDSWARLPSSSDDVRLVAAALELGAEAGGDVARSVDRVAATLRERRQLRAEVLALATQARTSAAVLAIAPVGFTILVAGVEPAAVRFLTSTPLGLACLATGFALEGAGAVWMARIVRSVT